MRWVTRVSTFLSDLREGPTCIVSNQLGLLVACSASCLPLNSNITFTLTANSYLWG
jgi:hypothetical protein